MVWKCILLVKECDLEPAGNCIDIKMHVLAEYCSAYFLYNKERPVTPTERRDQRARDILEIRIFKSGGEEVASTHRGTLKPKTTNKIFFSEIKWRDLIFISWETWWSYMAYRPLSTDSHQEMRIQRGGEMSCSDIVFYTLFICKYSIAAGCTN